MNETQIIAAPVQNKRLPESNPAEGRFVLHYNPSRAASALSATAGEKHFNAFVGMFVVVCIFLALAAALCLANGLWQIPLLMVPVSVIPFLFLDVCRPTNIEVGPEGIRLHWIHPAIFLSGPWVSWQQVKYADYIEGKVSGMPKKGKCFDLNLDLSKISPSQRMLMETFSTTVTTKCDPDHMTIRLLESGFFHENDQDIIRNQLYKHMPAESLNSSLVARLQFGDVPAYTSLWLDRFNNSPGADRSTIPDGTKLADGKYQVLSRLGSGGQAVVYDGLVLNAQDPAANRPCVLKEFVLPVRGGMEIKQRAVENIQREAGLLKTLNHPQIVSYIDLFIEGPRAYLVMERIDGTPLHKVLQKTGTLGTVQTKDLALQMCDLLQYLHTQAPPVVHRDFTPENLILGDDNRIKLIDFNVAHRLESTSTKTVVGKHAYVPPEQFRGKPTTQSDIYAFGATLFFLLTGDEPEPITKSDPSVKNVAIDKRLAAIVMRATEPEAENRYGDVAEILAALKEIPC